MRTRTRARNVHARTRTCTLTIHRGIKENSGVRSYPPRPPLFAALQGGGSLLYITCCSSRSRHREKVEKCFFFT